MNKWCTADLCISVKGDWPFQFQYLAAGMRRMERFHRFPWCSLRRMSLMKVTLKPRQRCWKYSYGCSEGDRIKFKLEFLFEQKIHFVPMSQKSHIGSSNLKISLRCGNRRKDCRFHGAKLFRKLKCVNGAKITERHLSRHLMWSAAETLPSAIHQAWKKAG